MKRLNFALCALFVLMGTMSATTYNRMLIDGLYYNLNDSYKENGVTIQRAEVASNPNKYSGNVTIPATVEYQEVTYQVKAVGGSAFLDCSNLTNVVISDGVTYIGSNAFQGCNSLLSVSIPNSVTSIGSSAFRDCYILKNVQLPETMTSLPASLFIECHSLAYMKIPDGVTYIPEQFFYGCNNLQTVIIPDGVNSIGGYAFAYCNNQLKTITIPSSVTSIGGSAFYSCSALSSVYITDLSAWCKIAFTSASSNPCYYGRLFLNGDEVVDLVLPSDITTVKQYAFYNCKNIKSLSVLNNVQSIESYAFAGCSDLTSVRLGANIANLNKDVFSDCTSLRTINWNITNFIDFASYTLNPFYNFRKQITSFTFGENVQHIPAYMCYEMSNLNRIDIPASVTSVGEGAFAYCSHLTEINAAAGSPLYSSEDGVLFNTDKTSLIIYPAGRSASSYTVPSTVQTIEPNAFYGCENLASITIPASVTSIGAGNNTIPMWSFLGTTPATIVQDAFPADVYLIVNNTDAYKAAWPEYASRIFPREYAEQTLNLTAQPDKSALHMAIGEENLSNVIKLTISGTINSYDLMIMRNKMINLRDLDLTDASIEANAYSYYTGLCSHADTLLAHSFQGLRSIKLPRTLKYAEYAMADCPDIKYAEFNGGVIGTNVLPYRGNGDLQVVLNEGVTEIKPYAFATSNLSHAYYDNNNTTPNTKLRSISLPNSLGKVETKRFWYCRNLIEVTLGDELTKIEDFAFSECTSLTSIMLPSQLETIGNLAFQGTKIKELYIPQKLKSIGYGAFMNGNLNSSSWEYQYNLISRYNLYIYNSGSSLYYYDNGNLKGGKLYSYNTHGYVISSSASLQKITFAPNSQLKEIGVAAFYYAQLDSLILPDSLTTIGQYAFVGNKQLKSIRFGEGSQLRIIKCGVFQNCDALETLVLPKGLTTIEELAFSSHTSSDALQSILFPENLLSIARGAFYGRKGLHRITFPTSVQTIGDYAFYGCTSLDEIRVPSSLRSVGNYAFGNCSNVTKVYTYTVEPVSIDQNTFSCWRNADLYVPSTSYYNYYYNTQWSQFLSLRQFDEEYSYFYLNGDYELGGSAGTIDGNPDVDLNPGAGLTVDGTDVQGLDSVNLHGNGDNVASIIACNNLNANKLVIKLAVKAGTWNFFCFPWDILVNHLELRGRVAIREYDGAARAQNGMGGWKNLQGNKLHKGRGYILNAEYNDTITITIQHPTFDCSNAETALFSYASENIFDAGWNLIGNPFTSYFDLDMLFQMGFTMPIITWNGKGYDTYRPGDDEYHFSPFEAFFVQAAELASLIFGADGRETYTQSKNGHGNSAPLRSSATSDRRIVNLTLSNDTYTDRTRVVFNPASSLEYEAGVDAAKFISSSAPLQLYTLDAQGQPYSINERPFADEAIALGYMAAEAGNYTLSAARMDAPVQIYDNEMGCAVDLGMGDYTFYTNAGSNNTRFAIRPAAQTPTSVDMLGDEYANEPVDIYTIQGVLLYRNVLLRDVQLTNGIYLVEGQAGVNKIMVK